MISKNLWHVIDWVYPPLCCVCGKLGKEICDHCLNQIDIVPENDVFSRQQNIMGEHSNEISEKQDLFFDQIVSWGFYRGNLKIVLREFKYKNKIGLISYLEKFIITRVVALKDTIDLIIPVPLGKIRRKERGYNQAEIIARAISSSLLIPIRTNMLIRVRETSSQVNLNHEERLLNVKGAFAVKGKEIRNKSILLVDDIATTGATLNECAMILKKEGAQKVSCFTIAKTNNFFK